MELLGLLLLLLSMNVLPHALSQFKTGWMMQVRRELRQHVYMDRPGPPPSSPASPGSLGSAAYSRASHHGSEQRGR